MFAQTPLDELLVVLAILLFIAEIYALRMIRHLRRLLGGGHGDYLLRVVFRFGVVAVTTQLLVTLSATLRLMDYIEFADIRLLMFLGVEVLLAIGFLWTVWEIHNLPADRYSHHPSTDRPKPCECLCKEVNDSIPTARAPVD